MDVARMVYDKENGNPELGHNFLSEEDTNKYAAKVEMPQEKTEDSGYERPVDRPTDFNNDIDDYDGFDMRVHTEIYLPAVTDYPIYQDLNAETAIYKNEDNYDTDEVILDPDNFEYFKGVSRKKIQ
jgi:hypothetical protein